jgi:hypothetical protein
MSEDIGETSDGYHTFNELYEHRHALFMALARAMDGAAWKSKLHADGTMFEGGWFVAGINLPNAQITYHLPMRLWNSMPAREMRRAPEWDGHTSEHVIGRLITFAITDPE